MPESTQRDQRPYFSIVTPTYNREKLLPRLYQSLCEQRFSDMEWVVIDDGSTDGTRELIARLQSDSPFPIVYRYQPNGGKHRALNHALEVASGLFFVDVDSDDYLIPAVLGRYETLWEGLQDAQRASLAGIVADCLHTDGRIVGRPFPEDMIITNSIDLRSKLKLRGDKLYLYKLDILRYYPIPEFEGERFIQESVRHRRVAREYELLATTLAGCVKDYQSDGLSADFSGRVPNNLKNPKGYRLRTREAVNLGAKENALELWKECINYSRFCFHCGDGLKAQFNGINKKALLIISLPLGFMRYRKDLAAFPMLRRNPYA